MRTRSQDTNFMDLPVEMKAKVFHYLDGKSCLQVRFTCSKFKTLIDTYVGLTISLDEHDWPRSRIIRNKNGALLKIVKNKQFRKTEFFKKICIKRAWLTKCTMTDFFRYPLHLESILLGRGTSKEVFASIITNCKTLVDLQMQTIVSARMTPEDFNNSDQILLRKLRTLSFFMDPTSSIVQWDTGAHNVLETIQRIRSPRLYRFYMDTWTSPKIGIFETVKVLLPFLLYHASLRTVILGINHMNGDDTRQSEVYLMNNLAKTFIEPIFDGVQLSQKSITFSNLKIIEFQALYPYIKAQNQLEKLTVTNWLGRTQNWLIYKPIFEANRTSLRQLHLSVETDTPFDFRIISDLHGLKELALFINGVALDAEAINGVNINTIPQGLELLILSNILMSTQDVMTISNRTKSLKIMAIVQVRGTASTLEGMRIDFVEQTLAMRNLEALLLCGVWLPTVSKKKAMQNITMLLTGRREYYLITDQNPNVHHYWNLTRMENAQNANLSFHLLLPY